MGIVSMLEFMPYGTKEYFISVLEWFTEVFFEANNQNLTLIKKMGIITYIHI